MTIEAIRSIVIISGEVLIQVELFIIQFGNVEDLTRSILNLSPEFVVHNVTQNVGS